MIDFHEAWKRARDFFRPEREGRVVATLDYPLPEGAKTRNQYLNQLEIVDHLDGHYALVRQSSFIAGRAYYPGVNLLHDYKLPDVLLSCAGKAELVACLNEAFSRQEVTPKQKKAFHAFRDRFLAQPPPRAPKPC